MANTVHPVTATISVGQVVKFNGYTSLEAGQEPILLPGQLVRIDAINEVDGAMTAVPVEGGQGDMVFIEEIEVQASDVAVDADAAGTLTPFDEPTLRVAAMASVARKTEKVKPKGKAIAKPKAVAKSKAKATAKVEAKPAVKAAPVKAVKLPPTKIKAGSKSQQKRLDVQQAELPMPEPEKIVVETTAVETPAPVATTLVVSGVTTEVGRVSDSERVMAILAGQDALDAAKALVAQAEETYFTLGGVLSHIYYEGIHKTLGYDGKRGFEEYVEKELGVAYRKAMYLIDIYTKFRALNIDERRLTQIGWSKAKELTRFATAENFETLVEAATEKSREELIDYLRSSFTNAETGAQEQARKVKLGFSLFADQAETVTRALDAAKDRVGNDNLNQALEYICAEWLSLSEGIEVPLEDAIRHLEAKYGVRLVPQSAAEATDEAAAIAVGH